MQRIYFTEPSIKKVISIFFFFTFIQIPWYVCCILFKSIEEIKKRVFDSECCKRKSHTRVAKQSYVC